MIKYLQATGLLDFQNPSIQALIQKKGWQSLDEYNKISKVYKFVQDEIYFAYNKEDALPASTILKDGYGQCNTKAILLMALLRGVNIPCRIHASWVDKSFQKGVVNGLIFKLSPDKILHSWVELFYQGKWYALEGVILDTAYLKQIQHKFDHQKEAFNQYAVAVPNLSDLQINWTGCDTFIQSEAVTDDLGIYNSPDELFNQHQQQFCAIKHFLYANIGRHVMNKNVKHIRDNT